MNKYHGQKRIWADSLGKIAENNNPEWCWGVCFRESNLPNNLSLQDGPLPVINGVVTPFVTSRGPHGWAPCLVGAHTAGHRVML